MNVNLNKSIGGKKQENKSFFCRDASVVYRRFFKPQNIKVSINDGFIIME